MQTRIGAATRSIWTFMSFLRKNFVLQLSMNSCKTSDLLLIKYGFEINEHTNIVKTAQQAIK